MMTVPSKSRIITRVKSVDNTIHILKFQRFKNLTQFMKSFGAYKYQALLMELLFQISEV